MSGKHVDLLRPVPLVNCLKPYDGAVIRLFDVVLTSYVIQRHGPLLPADVVASAHAYTCLPVQKPEFEFNLVSSSASSDTPPVLGLELQKSNAAP